MIRYETASDPLSIELRERVAGYFASTGKSPKADARFWIKLISCVSVTTGLWAALAFGKVPAPFAWPVCALLGLAMASVGFNVAHDAVHGAISTKPWVNRAWGHVFDVFGANAANWDLIHNYTHHAYTNVGFVDRDLEPGGSMVFHPRGTRKPIHRWQHLYAPLLYALAFVAWVVAKDFRTAAIPDPRTGRRQPRSRLVSIVAWKLVHFALYLAIPLYFSGFSTGQVLLGYLTVLIFVGLPIELVFQLPHLTEGTAFPVESDDDRLAGSHVAHQLRTTSDFATDSLFWNLVAGGQNHQLEHHLLPRVCHTHLPDLAPILREVAEKHGLPYRSHPSFMAALRAHLRLLRALGRGEVATTP